MLTVVGMGPAGLQWLIPAAREAIAAAEALVGGSWRGSRPVPGAASWCWPLATRCSMALAPG